MAFACGSIVQASAPSVEVAAASPDAVLQWNQNAGDAAVAACISPAPNPLHESRMYAMMHLAIHDALNAIELHSSPYAYKPQALHPNASPEAAVAGAARTSLCRCSSS